MAPWRLALLTLALTTTGLAGCIGDANDGSIGSSGLVDEALSPRDTYDTARGWSMPTSPALYQVLDGVKAMVPSFDGVEIAVGLFLPEIEGCDWEASELPETCRLPAVLDGGPYYLDAVDRDKYRPPWIEWLVPRGYAVMQVSLRGTGESGGCMDYKSPQDVDDMSAVIDWVAAQPWSNGNVGMGGRSYDGTTAWAGAASGNRHLKTIVPISGAVDAPFMYFKNGTAELRMLIPHAPIYWAPYGLGIASGDPTWRIEDWPANICTEVAEAHVEAGYSALTGDASAEYWRERDLTQRIVDDYQGSVWVIHGMEDWNVNPSQAVPFIQELQDAGIPTLGWLGQWAHAYPDRMDEHRNVRWDWADKVVKWFDLYLKGEGEPPRLGVEVEDSLYTWRHEETYPPRDATRVELELAAGGTLAPKDEGASGSYLLTGPPSGVPLSAIGGSVGDVGSHAAFTSAPLAEDLRIAGLTQLHLTATPTTPAGGSVFAELYDIFPDGRSVRIGWGGIHLAYHAGGNTDPATLTPGSPVVAKMQFEPMDAHVGEGHQLRLVVHKAGVEDILPSSSPEATELSLGDGASLLRLPVVEREDTLRAYAAPGLAP